MSESAGRAPRLFLLIWGRVSGSTGRAPRSSLPVRGTCRDQLDAPRVRPFQCGGTSRASAASGMAWHGRQGTTGPGDALMVGIPAVRLRF